MKYINNENKERCLELCQFYSNSNEAALIKYLRKKKMINDYFEDILSTRMKQQVWVDLDKDDIEEIFEENGQKYIKMSDYDSNLHVRGALFLVLPKIGDDDRKFAWKKVRGKKELKCVLSTLNFEYHVTYDGYCDAIIDVKYTKEDNYHKTKVTIAHIEVENATNRAILAAIKKWIDEFRYDLNFAEIAS